MKAFFWVGIMFWISGVGSLQAQQNLKTGLPFPQGAKVSPLMDWEDKTLEAELSKRLHQNPKWHALLQQKRMAVGLVDLGNPSRPRFAQVNGDMMMYAASLPKIAILLSAMDAIEEGSLEDNEVIRKDLHLMISKSDNQASTRMIDRLGFEKIESVLTAPDLLLYDKDHGGGLWVGKRYASQGRRYPEPLKGLSHAATANQVCRFYYLLAYGELVTRKRSAEMLTILQDPKLHHKFVNTLDQVAPKARLFRKSGSWKTYHSDSIMVMCPDWRQYILVALVDDADGENIIRKLVLPVEKILKLKK